MIYRVSGNVKRGIGYVKSKNSMFKPKPKQIVIKTNASYSYFTYGHTHNIYFAHKPWADKTSWRTNHKRPKKTWVPKDKIIYVAILSNKVGTPILVHELWVL